MRLAFVEACGFRGIRERLRLEFPPGFVVLTGRNGVGKSTVLDVVDFALTGTISRFSVTEAKGGGLSKHIWWVGAGSAEDHYVRVGFIGDDGSQVDVRRTRDDLTSPAMTSAVRSLVRGQVAVDADTLMRTSLIRDEQIAALSLDLPEQARFAAVRQAIGSVSGPDHSRRTASILSACDDALAAEQSTMEGVRGELGRSLEAVTEARQQAERSAGLADALRIIESIPGVRDAHPADRGGLVASWIAQRKLEIRDAEEVLLKLERAASELERLGTPEGQSVRASIQQALEAAEQEMQRSTARLAEAERLEATERVANEYAAHLGSLIRHGEALGLKEGHCPLCRAGRSTVEFDRAIATSKAELAVRGGGLGDALRLATEARASLRDAEDALSRAQMRATELDKRHKALQDETDRLGSELQRMLSRPDLGLPAGRQAVRTLLASKKERTLEVERAVFVVEASGAVERLATLEGRVAQLRSELDRATARVAEAEAVRGRASQIDASARTVANELLTEQFDTVMPLLKELYRRLRPHPDWTEIEAEFGGRVRASLNFIVGERCNPQFLFSSGQRRATGLAFLLAVHLSRPWCAWRTLLLDDPVQHIDDYRALNLAEVLGAIRRTGRQIVVSVEDPALSDLLCRRLRGAEAAMGRRYELRIGRSGSVEVARMDEVPPLARNVLGPALAS